MKSKSFFSVILVFIFLIFLTACSEDQPVIPLTDEESTMITQRSVRPFKGYYINDVQICVPPDINGVMKQCITGTGQATHLGHSTYYAEQIFSPAQNYGLGITFTAANGDQFSAESYPMNGGPLPGGGVYFFETITIDDGTGRFEGIEGEIDYYGECTGEGGCYVEFDGWLAY